LRNSSGARLVPRTASTRVVRMLSPSTTAGSVLFDPCHEPGCLPEVGEEDPRLAAPPTQKPAGLPRNTDVTSPDPGCRRNSRSTGLDFKWTLPCRLLRRCSIKSQAQQKSHGRSEPSRGTNVAKREYFQLLFGSCLLSRTPPSLSQYHFPASSGRDGPLRSLPLWRLLLCSFQPSPALALCFSNSRTAGS
jgi:hypothetical protein